MEAKESTLFNLLDGTKHFIVPHYQRLYSWEWKQCEQLIRDLEKVSELQTKRHFVGSIVYVSHLAKVDGVNTFVLIDGQQRMTTLSLIILAILRKWELSNEELRRKVNRTLRNGDEPVGSNGFYKLRLTRSDDSAYREIVDAVAEGRAINEHENNRVHRNFLQILERISESRVSPSDLFSALSRLDVVYISLGGQDDHPQAIFESLNSTGKSLSQTDLIRNYVLMDLSPEDQVLFYDRHWSKIEQAFYAKRDTEFEDFVRVFLASKMHGRYPLQREVFQTFKEFFSERKSNGDTHDEILQSFRQATQAYSLIQWSSISRADSKLESALSGYRATRTKVLNPVLMPWADKGIPGKTWNESRFIEAVEILEAYLVRRAFCGLGNNALDKVVARCFELMEKSPYQGEKALADAMLSLGSGRMRFPLDDEMRRRGLDFELYLSPMAEHILVRLERHLDRKGLGSLPKVSIEHILPQTMTNSWKTMLGEGAESVRDRLIHTIGNLTLTPYNSELGNNSFDQKKNASIVGYRDSKFAMTRAIADYDIWDEASIVGRSKMLLEQVIQIWPTPALYFDPNYSKQTPEIEPDDVSMRDLLAEGLISSDESIFWSRPKVSVVHQARVNESGTIVVSDGDEYETPTAATRHFTTSNYNGWKVWTVGSVDGETLDDLRARFVEQNSST